MSADRRIGVCDPNFPAGGLGAPAGSGAVLRKQMHFDNNLSKICLKSGLASKKVGAGDISYGVPTMLKSGGGHAPVPHRYTPMPE